MIYTMRTRLGRGLEQFTAEKLIEQQIPRERWPAEGDPAPYALEARIDWGRWLVDCLVCKGASYVDDSDLRAFCLSCQNQAIDHRWVPVVMPADRTAIEEALEGRPEELRHWSPGQTVEELRAGAPVQGPLPSHEMLRQVAQDAGAMRDELSQRNAALQEALKHANRGALLVIRHLEQARALLAHEREFSKQLAESNVPAPHTHDHDGGHQ